jgi:hypothetical protein
MMMGVQLEEVRTSGSSAICTSIRLRQQEHNSGWLPLLRLYRL